ncbi:hypothetical protein E1176_18335 [Fulvivirga sp. RKSG066]|uniref:cyclic nucleotide-binding domain-containing protein n=1 Tax=Fulvivirga aurantia TaxID=2529383 RepID=UPI0012BD793B|nr:cyclic nucleotide-binding domain-containing protein [Fulvivirga aurantia]MTI22995.1 hypothetical protein [Fulvivirga aurantia]
MGFKNTILKILNVEEDESLRVFFLLGMGFFMGIYLATLSVGASTLFLQSYEGAQLEQQLALALLVSGVLGIIFTAIYNFFQGKVKFTSLAIGATIIITLILLAIEIAFRSVENVEIIHFFAFTFIVPSNFIILLIFWGTFGRMFNLRQSKRIIGSIDTGQLIASIIALFAIPIVINKVITTQQLLFVTLLSIVGYLLIFLVITFKKQIKKSIADNQSVGYKAIIKNKYMGLMALFVIVSMVAVKFIDYSFLSVTTAQFNDNALPSFLSLFEAAVVIFSFLFQTFVTDRIIALYGLKVSLLINPLLLALFTIVAIPMGYAFGYGSESTTFIFFFIIISMSKLFSSSLKDALDGPAFKLFFLPIDGAIRFDVQTKVEGVITAFAGLMAGGLIILINNVDVFSLIHISIFTLPVLAIWYFVTTKMHNSYRHTLHNTLINNKVEHEHDSEREYAVNRVLEKEINSKDDHKILYGLKLMEKLEPALFESSILKLQESSSRSVKHYAKEKIKALDLSFSPRTELAKLASKAALEAEDNELLSVPPEKLHKLSKSIKSSDRILAAKLLRKLISDENIFILLELLRDIDPKVKAQALITARSVKRPETWTILIELLDSPKYSSAATAALIEAGQPALFHLESAFHKSGQTDNSMLKIVQIMGRIGGHKAIELLWNKIEYPDKRIVKQILLSYRYFNYQANQKEINNLTNLLETEIGKTIWNLAALTELSHDEHYNYLREALKEEIAGNLDTIYVILSILYDPQSVQLVRENIERGTSDGIAFAIELLDLFVSQELKPKLFPLLDDISVTEKVRILQVHFPREDYNEIQVLNYLLNKNYNQINRWTKACALHAIAFLPDFRISRGLLAQLFNSDKLLQEAAAWVIYHKDSAKFDAVAQRLKPDTRRFLEDSLEKNRLLEGLDDGFFLGIEMVMKLKGIHAFENIKGVILCDLVDKISTTIISANQTLQISKKDEGEQIYIIAEGEVSLYSNDVEIKRLSEGEAFGNVFELDNPASIDALVGIKRTVIFKLSVHDFYNVMANHHELAQGFIKNISKQLVTE